MAQRLYVGTRKGLFTVEKKNGSWSVDTAEFLGDPVTMVLPEPGGERVHAALEHGHFGPKLQASRDGGRTWAEAPTPKFPEKPEGVEDVDPVRKKEVPWSLKTVWALETGHPSQEGRMWCGSIPGGLFRSDDGGESWELVRSLWDHPERKKWMGGGADFAGIHSIEVDPRDGDHVTLGVSIGGVWITRDSGETWEQGAHGMRAEYMPEGQQYEPGMQDPHRVVACPSAPDTMWAQHHCGIFRTTDGSKSWTEIEDVSPSAFGFAVCVHPKDPDRAWFVPGIKDEKRIPVDGKLVVNRTSDGGKSFDHLTEGLPQEHAYDLVFRHAMDIDETGDVLAFGSTTGSLWVTEDGGDGWQLVSAHLPPVYCVRFGG